MTQLLLLLNRSQLTLSLLTLCPPVAPGPEDEKTMDEMTVGRGALITNKFFRKAGAAMKTQLR
jgi:hypothetical protein